MLDDTILNLTTIGCNQNHLKDTITFDKECLRNIMTIGQVDKKFIAAMTKGDKLLLLFDQHAVHERIRLEKLLKSKKFYFICLDLTLLFLAYKNTKSTCDNKIILFLQQSDISLLKKYEKYWSSLGLSIEFFVNGIKLTEIPSCLHSKFNESVCWILNI